MADNNIALGVKQPEPVNYLGQMAQVMGIRALQDEMSGSEDTRAAIRGGMSPTDPKLLQYGKRGEAVYKAGLAGEKESLAATKSRFGLMGQVFGYVKDNPTLENANAALDTLGQHGVLTPEAVAQSKAQVAADPSKIVTYATQLFNQAIEADKQQADATSRRNTDESNKTRIQAAGISAGPGWAQANLAREKWKDEQQRGEVIPGEGQFLRKDRFGNLTPIDQYGPQFGPNAPVDQQSAGVLRNNLAGAAPAGIPVNAMLTGGQPPQAPAAGPTVAAANAAAAQQNVPRPANAKGLTEVQAKSTGFANRAAQAHSIINIVGANGEIQPGLFKRSLEAVPLIGEGLGTMANITQSDAEQQVEQAQRNFVNAILRQESGAAVNQSEFDNARKQYFPQPGDGPKVIEQKKQNREMAIKSLEIAAGPGIKKGTPGAGGGKVVSWGDLPQ